MNTFQTFAAETAEILKEAFALVGIATQIDEEKAEYSFVLCNEERTIEFTASEFEEAFKGKLQDHPGGGGHQAGRAGANNLRAKRIVEMRRELLPIGPVVMKHEVKGN